MAGTLLSRTLLIQKSVNIRGKSIQLQYQCIIIIPEVSRASQRISQSP